MNSQPTRTYYFQGELLGLADFVRDQQYGRDIVAAMNQAVYSPGVIQGLTPTAAQNTLSISAGLGVNGNGVPLIAAGALAPDPKAKPATAGDYFIALRYGDSLTENADMGNLLANHTITETPVVELAAAAPTDPTYIVLGKATVDGSGNVTGVDAGASSGRQTSHLLIAGDGAAIAEAAVPEGAAAAANTVALGDSLAGPGAPLPAPLSAGVDFHHGSAQAVASFGFVTAAGQAGTVSIGTGAPGAFDLLRMTCDGATVMTVDTAGTVHTASDAGLKSDVTPITDAVQAIGRLRGVSYLGPAEGSRRMGVLAHEVEEVFPSAVRKDAAGVRMVAYTDLIGVLIEAVKELSAKVSDIEGRLPADPDAR